MKWWPFSFRTRAAQTTSTGDSFIADWMDSSAGGGDYKNTVDTAFKANPIVYGAVRLIADNVGRVPLIAYEEVGKELRELGPQHPAQRTIDRPNETYNRVRFVQALMTDLVLHGNYYVQDATTSFTSLPHLWYRLRPDKVAAKLNAQRTRVEAYEYKPDSRRDALVFVAEDVLHSWLIDPIDDVKGFAPVKVASASVSLANDARTWNAALMENKGQHSSIIKVNGDMTPEQEKALRESFAARYQGKKNAGKSIVIRNGEVEVQSLSWSPADVQWVEGIKLTLRDMATALFVPSVLLNDTENNTYSNYSAAIRIFHTMTVFPLLDMLCDDLTWFLAPRFGDNIRIRYDLDAVPALQPSREERWQQVSDAWWLSINEKREHLGWGRLDIPEADTVWIPGTLVPLGEPLPDFADNVDGRVEAVGLDTRASKQRRAWLRTERLRSQYYKGAQRLIEGYFRSELRQLKEVLADSSPATASDRLQATVIERQSQLQRMLEKLTIGIADTFAAYTHDSIVGKTGRAETNPWSTYIVPWIEKNSAEKVSQITETTREQIREALAEGMALGEHIEELAARLDTLYLKQIIPNRSETIARTEVLAASNMGSQAGARATGLPLKKTWLATPDARTRTTHAMADGQEVPLQEPYNVGGYSMMFPGDSSLGADAGEIINCRCTETYSTVR